MTERCEGDGEGGGDHVPTHLERLGSVVEQRSNDAVWRKFLVAQATVRAAVRRRDKTTQRIFLTGLVER